jgi:hypothetical protein
MYVLHDLRPTTLHLVGRRIGPVQPIWTGEMRRVL